MKLQILNAQTHEELFDFDLISVIRQKGKCIVGRSATSNLLLGNSDISRCHGEFSYHKGEYYFTDTGSTNGCVINDEIATKEHAYLLKAFDEIRLGDFLLIPQPLTGTYEDATNIAPIAFASLSKGATPGKDEISSLPEIIHEIAQPQPVDESTKEELPAAVAVQPDNVESNIDDIPLEQSIANVPAKDMDTMAASTPEVAAESSTIELSEELNEDIPAKVTDTTTLQESVLPKPIAQSNIADIPVVIAEKPEFREESHTDTNVAENIVEENTIAVAEQSVPVEVAQASIVAPEVIAMESTNAIVDSRSKATDEKLGDYISAGSEILKEKYIIFLAHDSQKAELVDFILRHQETFSKCLLMASSAISEALDENNIFVRRVLSNLTADGYQEVNSAIASKNLLGVIFLRDFLSVQSSQANDEALCKACNINQVILATNIATAQAFEGYLQHLIPSTPKVGLAETLKQ